MLNLLHRHVLKEILVATALAMGLFIFVLLVGNVLRDVAELVAAGKLSMGISFKLIGLLIPYVASYALPFGVLTGTLIALGRLSSQQEIVAMKAAGLSLYQIASPVFVISFIGMVMAVIVNLHYGPQSRLAYKQLMASAITENPIGFIEERRFINEFPGYVIYMGGRDEQTMKDFWIWELDEEKRVTRFVRAAEGELDYDKQRNEIVLTLKDGTAEVRSEKNPESFGKDVPDSLFFGELPLALPLDKIFGEKGKRRARLKEMTFAQLMSERDKALAEEAVTGSGVSEERLKVQIHLQKNCAMAFSVFSLAVFGVPLAIQVGRKETYANLAIALVIAMTYYFLMIMVSWLEGNPAMRADILMWLPNIIFQAVGFWLIRRASRH
ncbi:MAG: LptF/LptG family permease [Opitutales bacterium]|jgi:lipopolysaccharide export system permease protein|nr:LptF/LptG family permease [Opitutales bacterium]MDP4778417.1 LptF/LptG family permease [Opitutales bacterium]MDP4878495.1 LptF/LptG family permease [Opitutales bacterium]MDP4883342.1 LptF/LptG family permease [Opitutales bacterium]